MSIMTKMGSTRVKKKKKSENSFQASLTSAEPETWNTTLIFFFFSFLYLKGQIWCKVTTDHPTFSWKDEFSSSMSGISKNFLDAYNVKIHSHCLYASPIKKKKIQEGLDVAEFL